MKRLPPGDKLILDRPLLLVGQERAVFFGHLLPEFVEPRLHRVRGGLRVGVVDGQLVEFAGEKPGLDRRRLGIREETLAGFNLENPQFRLIAGQGDGKVQRMSGRPRDQLFRRITPAQAEGRFDEVLRDRAERGDQQDRQTKERDAERTVHGPTLADFRNRGKRGSRRGFALVEMTIALAILTVVGLVMLQLSLNILAPRQWSLQQSLTDAYLTFERSYAERVPFATLTANSGSPWPVYPNVSVSTVEIGRLPGGTAVTGTVTRTRMADPNNYPIDGGSGSVTTNPASLKVWRVQSVLTYQIGGRTYAKSRTVIRSQ
jgi:prepilin-type N-terminal cleavage/methylation domain-containing protein